MEAIVKNKVVMFAILIGVLGFLVGLFGKLTGHHYLVANATWHLFAQTSFLFAIAWGIGKDSVTKKDSA